MKDALLPSGWKVVRLGDVLKEADVRAKDYQGVRGITLPVLSLTKNNGLILQSERFSHRVATEDVSEYKVVEREWVVYNPYVLWEGAIHALWKHTVGLVSPVYPVWKVVEADPYFMDCLLKTPPLMETYERVCSGVVKRRRSISKAAFQGFEAILPSLPEQQAVAYALRAVQDACAARRHELNCERERKFALMEVLFTCGLRGETQKETDIGPIPASWTLTNVGNVYRFTSKPRELKVNEYAHIPFVPMEMIPLASTSGAGYIMKPYHELTSGVYFERGDLLLAKITPSFENGKQCIIDELPLGFGVATTEVIPIKDIAGLSDKHFLFYYLLMPKVRSDLTSKMEGTTGRQRLSKNAVGKLLIPMPPLDEQRDIVEVLTACDQKIATLEAEAVLYDELFRALLNDLMIGRVSARALINAPEGVTADATLSG